MTVAIIAISACDDRKIFEDNVRIAPDGWKQSEIARFETTIDEHNLAHECNIYVNVRNNSRYKWMELWLFVNVYAPSGSKQRDTLKIQIADHHGKWLGNGLGDQFDNRMLFQQKIRFPEAGKYIFEYEHGMRDEPLMGIEDIGLRIEK